MSPPHPVLDRAASGYRASLASHALRLACKVASVVVLGRLIPPTEHGTFALAATVFMSLVVFRDLGLGAIAVQAAELNQEQGDALAAAHMIMGTVLAVVIFALAGPAAAFYGSPAIATPARWLALGMLLLAFNAWPRVLLTRSLRFAEVNQIESAAAVVGTLTSITAALAGAGAVSLALFLVASEGTILGLGWRLVPPTWRGFSRLSLVRPNLRGGLQVTGHNLLTAWLNQIDTAAVGRWFGPVAAGAYARPTQLLGLATQHLTAPLNQVLTATLARLDEASAEGSQHLLRTANLIAHLTLPLNAVCFALPEEVIHLALGPNWAAATPVLRWLALGAAAGQLTAVVPAICLARGNTGQLAALSLASLGVTGAGLCLARDTGPAGIAGAVAISQLLLVWPRAGLLLRSTALTARELTDALIRPGAVALAATGTMSAAKLLAADLSWPIRLALGLTSAAFATGVLAAVWPALRAELRHISSHLPLRR